MRLPYWESILAEKIEAAKHLPFKWGQHDCILWAGGVAEAITGNDYLSEFKGQYKTKKEAYRLIKSIAKTLPEAVDQYVTRKPVLMARRGDVVWNGEGMGVCNGVYSIFLTPKNGLISIKTKDCTIAWHID